MVRPPCHPMLASERSVIDRPEPPIVEFGDICNPSDDYRRREAQYRQQLASWRVQQQRVRVHFQLDGDRIIVTKPSRAKRMRTSFARLTKRVRQVLAHSPCRTLNQPTQQQREKNTMAEAPVKSIGQMRAEAEEKGIQQLTRFDDPALVDLITKMHNYAADKDWCAEFDRLAQGLGIPARPKKDYFTVTRSGTFEFNGQVFEVEAVIDVFGEVDGDGNGIEASALAEYEARYGTPFEEVVAAKWQEQALSKMVSTFTFTEKAAAAKDAKEVVS